uniref:Uncharacterized protein n=1 Tax=Bionectria ochroleuca TaxID=29856 RepID=A0A8H7N9T9_BIOOC
MSRVVFMPAAGCTHARSLASLPPSIWTPHSQLQATAPTRERDVQQVNRALSHSRTAESELLALQIPSICKERTAPSSILTSSSTGKVQSVPSSARSLLWLGKRTL